MATKAYRNVQTTGSTPQNQPILGSSQVPNNAGGYAWAIDDWQRLDRFLVLGSEGGTYYVGEQKLTRENASAVLRCIQADGARTVARIVEISDAGRAPKNEPAIFALALAAQFGDAETKKLAYAAVPKVCRFGTAIMHFAMYKQQFGGWGRGMRRAVGDWFNRRSAAQVAYQAIKYQARDGWALGDLLRLSHPIPPTDPNDEHKLVYKWIVDGWDWVGPEPHPLEDLRQIWAYEKLKKATDKAEVVELISRYSLPFEAVTTEWRKYPEVWKAIWPNLGLTALIRNLPTLTRLDVVDDEFLIFLAKRLETESLRQARVHPVALLNALVVYKGGRSIKGDSTWSPKRQVVDLLDKAFYDSFGAVEPTGKRLLLGLDVSGSMAGTSCAGLENLRAREACAAMALVTAATESRYEIVAFDSGQSYGRYQTIWTPQGLKRVEKTPASDLAGTYPLTISPRQRLDDVVEVLDRTGGGGTDCSLPIEYARIKRIPIDAFVIYTDSETWAGVRHPAEALQIYRKEVGVNAKLVVVAMAATHVTIADPTDGGHINVVGFDTATPQLISDFVRG